MKIRTKKDREDLYNTIKEELGIDVLKYRNEDVVNNFVDMLVFPKYVINWVSRPILISFVVFIIGFFVFDLVHVEYVIYGIVGLIMFLIVGTISGLLFLTWKIKSDIRGIVNYSLELMQSTLHDIKQLKSHINNGGVKNALGLLFNGIIHVVTIPMITEISSDKIPIFSGIINRIIKKILTIVSNKVKFDEEKFKQELNAVESELKAETAFSKLISSSTKGLDKVMNFTFGVAQFPLKIVLGIVVVMLLLFLYIIN